MHLLDHRLLVVTGKGGVGRTTTTAALGLAAARLGKRVAVVELAGQDSLANALGREQAAYTARTVAPGLDVVSLSPTDCLADFGQRKLRVRALSRWFFESRLMTGFVEAVPGLQDLVQLGKIENMLLEPLPGDPVYDLIILDGPATGHGLTLLAAARTMREMTGVGPFHDLARIIEDLLEDHERTGIVLVTLPEALPVNESLQLITSLVADHVPPSLVVVNQVRPAWPHAVPAATLLGALAPTADVPPALRRARGILVGIAQAEVASDADQTQVLADLAVRLPAATGRHVPTTHLPRLDDPTDLTPLATALVQALGGTP